MKYIVGGLFWWHWDYRGPLTLGSPVHLIDIAHCLYEAVVIHTADKIRQEIWSEKFKSIFKSHQTNHDDQPDITVNAGEYKLEEVENAGAKVTIP